MRIPFLACLPRQFAQVLAVGQGEMFQYHGKA